MLAKSISSLKAIESYETRLCAVRTLFEQESALVTQILAPRIEPDVLELFLIYFSGLGVAMTEPVEGWIRRAGAACQEMGLDELGRSLITHASHEANHHLMLIEDTRSLVDRWNERHQAPIHADEILAHPATEGVLRYRELHEEESPTLFVRLDHARRAYSGAMVTNRSPLSYTSRRRNYTSFRPSLISGAGRQVHELPEATSDESAHDARHCRLIMERSFLHSIPTARASDCQA